MPTAATPLGDVPGWWLDVACPAGCGRTHLPCRLLARRVGAGVALGAVAARLTCQRCGARAAMVEAVDDPQLDASGYVAPGAPAAVRVVVGCG